jgi:hypothetical protein
MPSHRQGSIPKHRARRPVENSGRHSQLNAATQAKRIAPESGPDPYGSGARPVTPEPPTRPFPTVRRHPRPPAGAGRHAGAGGGGEGDSDGGDGGLAGNGRHGRVGRTPGGVIAGIRRAAPSGRLRGLLVTPWFAAGAGLVIAAALSLNSPRTFLTYRPNNAPNHSKCASCQSQESVPTSRPGVQIRSVNPARIGGTGAAGPAVPIQIGPERNGVFSVTFTLPAGPAAHGWNLRFALPGRSITQVLGAQWRPDAADDGGVARLTPGGYVSPTNPAAMTVLVSASGPPVAPVDCVLNGQPCHFR